jgi:predicted nuclease of predicted toxin-antitoxin system
MRFLIDRCAGRLLAEWLRKQGHDVIESRELGPDPQLVYTENVAHAGLIRLPDVPSRLRTPILADVLMRFEAELKEAAIITVRGGRIRISRGPTQN